MSSLSWRAGIPLVLPLAACSALDITGRDVADYAQAVVATPTVGSVDSALDVFEGTTQTLRATRADGLDGAGSTLDAALLDTAAPTACAIVGDALDEQRAMLGLTSASAALVGGVVCLALSTSLESLVEEDGPLDAALEDDLAPAMASRDYTIEGAHVDVTLGDIDLVPRSDGFDLSVSLDGADLVIEDASVGPFTLDPRIDATFDRATVTWSATFTDRTTPFPWREACGQPLRPNPSPEADEIPRGLLHATLWGDVTGDFAVHHFTPSGFGILTPVASLALQQSAPDLADLTSQTAPLPPVDLVFPALGAVARGVSFPTTLDGTVGVTLDSDLDLDHDGILTGLDDCPYDADPDQTDRDWDGVGDACDPDDQPDDDWMWALLFQKMDHCGMLSASSVLAPSALRSVDPAEARFFDGLHAWADRYAFDWRWIVIDEDPRWPEDGEFVYLDEAALRAAAAANLEQLGTIEGVRDLALQVPLVTVPVDTGFIALQVDRHALADRFGAPLAARIELVVPDRFAFAQPFHP